MTTYAIGGQSSGDFKETSGRVQLLHVVTRNALGLLTPDAFTQANPPVVTTQKSTTLANITKVGVLGSSIAFTRPDYGNGYHGGPVAPGGVYNTGFKPLGIFLNDAIGNAFENTPGVASGRGPYVCGSGSCVAVSLYETKVQLGGGAGTPLVYAPGDFLYASVNGLITKTQADSYEVAAGATAATLIGVVKVAPDANSSLLVLDVRV
jgi:hypothetical protein